MKQHPRVVNYVDWDIVLKCKSGKYASKEECLKSIWTEEYGNKIEEYNPYTMISIMGQVIAEIMPLERRGYMLDTILSGVIINPDALLKKLYLSLMLLDVRETVFLNRYEDLYIIDKKGKYYTIEQYDELEESESNV